jgi:hypothetical protein
VNGLINTQMYNSPGIWIALIFITVGIGFKLSPAPSHQWTPTKECGSFDKFLLLYLSLRCLGFKNSMDTQKGKTIPTRTKTELWLVQITIKVKQDQERRISLW